MALTGEALAGRVNARHGREMACPRPGSHGLELRPIEAGASETNAVGRPSHVAFLVTVRYREPTYALRRGVEPKTHQRTYRVIAVSADEAILVAHELFYREVVASNVGWAREIVDASAEWMASA